MATFVNADKSTSSEDDSNVSATFPWSDDVLQMQMAKFKIPGMTLGIVTKGGTGEVTNLYTVDEKTNPFFFCRTEEEAKVLAGQMGMTWGGTGTYRAKGAYYYKDGSHEGTMWWGTGGAAAARYAEIPGTYRPLPPHQCRTEDEAKALATQMGMTWGGTGEYQVKGAYYYKEGQHEGTMWWGTGGDEDTISAPMSCVRFRPLYPRNDEDKFFYCRTEEEARVIAGKMGMAWGGTSGEDKVKGAYCYKEGEHKGKMWWGEGGAAAERYAPVTADRFRPLQQPKNDTEDDEFYCCWGAEFLGI